MNSVAKISKIAVTLTLLSVVAVVVGLLVATNVGNSTADSPVALVSKATPAAAPIQTPSWTPDVPPPGPKNAAHAASSAVGSLAPSDDLPLPPDTRSVDEKVADILMAAGDENSKSDKLIQLLTNAPPDSQAEIAHHVENMTKDDHYDGIADLLTNSSTPAAVSQVFFNNLLNRGNNLKLPMLLAVARNPDLPESSDAQGILPLFLQADYGTNWDQWSDAINTWLQQNQ